MWFVKKNAKTGDERADLMKFFKELEGQVKTKSPGAYSIYK